MRMSPDDTMQREISQSQRQTLSIPLGRLLEKPDSREQVEWRLPGVGAGEEGLFPGCSISELQDETF